MLRDDFYTISEFDSGETEIRAMLTLNPKHRIFEGHFPGQPVVPGVCMIQMVKELLEYKVKSGFSLHRADQVKFLTIIDPRQTPSFQVNIRMEIMQDSQVKVSGSFLNGDTVYCKIQGAYFLKQNDQVI